VLHIAHELLWSFFSEEQDILGQVSTYLTVEYDWYSINNAVMMSMISIIINIFKTSISESSLLFLKLDKIPVTIMHVSANNENTEHVFEIHRRCKGLPKSSTVIVCSKNKQNNSIIVIKNDSISQ
jgi:hypothetical protein